MKPQFLLAAALLYGCAAPLAAQETIALDEAAIIRLGLVFVQVGAPDNTAGARFPASVIASPQAASQLHALHSGVLERWHVQAGVEVAAGDVLATLRSSAVLALQQDWVAAQAAEQQSAYALTRDESLFAEGIIARQRLQETERQAREARFNLQSLQAVLEQAGFNAEDLLALQSEGRELGRYLLRAPAAGTVAHLMHHTGEMIQEGEPVLALTGDKLWISAELPARFAARVAPGQTLRLADTTATLLVQQMDQRLDASTQTVGVLAEFTAPVTLLPGQIVTLQLPPQADGIVVPADAVVHNGDETTVFVKVDGGVESRTLTLQAIGSDYLATSGLNAGEEVVVRGAAIIKGIVLGLGGE